MSDLIAASPGAQAPRAKADAKPLVAIGVAALLADVAVRAGVASVSGSLLVLVVASALVATGTVANRRAWPLLGAAAVVGSCLMLRSSPWLVLPDVIAAAGLLALAATYAKAGDPFDMTVGDGVVRGAVAGIDLVAGPAYALEAARPFVRLRAAAPVVRGAVLAGPVVAVLALLLGSADPVFASFFRLPTDVGELVLHAVLLSMGAWGMAGLFRSASTASVKDGRALDTRPILGRTEAMVLLGGLVVLFSVFAVSQVVAVTGGADHVLRTEGLTYAEYARSGFFQLIAVATITLGLIVAVRAVVHGGMGGGLLVVGEAAAVLTLAIVVVAVRRLHLYEAAFGLTMLRLMSTVVATWIGCVFAMLCVDLGTDRRRRWLLPASVGLGLVVLVGLHAVNPEAVVVRRNVEHFERTGRLDVDYLASLEDDADSAIADHLDIAPQLRVALCGAGPGEDRPWWSYNVSMAGARDARSRAC